MLLTALALLMICSGVISFALHLRKRQSDPKKRALYVNTYLILSSAAVCVGLSVLLTSISLKFPITTDAADPGTTSTRDTRGAYDPDEGDAEDLNEFFASSSEGETLVLPKRNYALSGHVLLPRENDVLIDARGTTFTGQAVFLGVGSSGLSWNGGTFVGDGTDETRQTFNLFKTNNSSFREMHFERTLSFGNHAFDLLGSTNVLIEHLTVTGYGESTDTSGLSPHALYAEAIQVDYALRSGIGNDATAELISHHGGEFDGTPSAKIVVRDSAFEPSYDEFGRMEAWAPTPFGSHFSDNPEEPLGELVLENSTIIDPIPVPGRTSGRWSGVLHFSPAKRIAILDNYLELSQSEVRPTWIEIERQESADIENRQSPEVQVQVLRNTFAGAPPFEGYIVLDGEQPEGQWNDQPLTAESNSLTIGREIFRLEILECAIRNGGCE